MKKVVIFGGGSGLSNLLLGLKEKELDLTVVVTIADDGGSTGKIRDMYDIPAPGDLRRVVVALSKRTDLEQLMNYRFDRSLQKHTIGNLILAALTDLYGDMSKAVQEYCDLLDVKHKVLPISNDSLTLVAEMMSGKMVYGETRIAHDDEPIKTIGYLGEHQANPDVIKAIKEADYVIFSSGSLYTSIVPNLMFSDLQKEIKDSSAKLIYVCNIMTEHGETDNYTVSNHLDAINRHLNSREIDIALVNNNYDIPQKMLDAYGKENSQLVKLDEENIDIRLIKNNFLNISKNQHIRHDIYKISDELDILINGG